MAGEELGETRVSLACNTIALKMDNIGQVRDDKNKVAKEAKE
jgi:hypothetical protein